MKKMLLGMCLLVSALAQANIELVCQLRTGDQLSESVKFELTEESQVVLIPVSEKNAIVLSAQPEGEEMVVSLFMVEMLEDGNVKVLGQAHERTVPGKAVEFVCSEEKQNEQRLIVTPFVS